MDTLTEIYPKTRFRRDELIAAMWSFNGIFGTDVADPKKQFDFLNEVKISYSKKLM